MRVSGLIPVLALVIVLLSACNKGDQINISGQYNGERESYLQLYRIDVDQLVYIDSVKISDSGDFKFRFQNELPDFYNIGFNENEFVTVIAYPGDNISLKFNGAKLQDEYTIEGSPESKDLLMLDLKLAQTLFSLDSLSDLYVALPQDPANEAKQLELEELYQSLVEGQRMYNIEYIIEHLSSFASIKALFQRLDDKAYVLYKTTDAQFLKLVSDTLNAYYPESRQAITLAQNLETELNSMQLNRLTALAQNAQSISMDIDLESIDGKRIKLSSFRNKSYVLLSFWSAQSKECIENNIQMKEYYLKYKRSGFEIYQVNIDANEDVWRQSVKFDELPWINVREDDPARSENALKYNVTNVPANYLIDKNGEIIGKNLFGRTLQIKLNQLFD
ncbi:MAG: thioredoxin-like domain-containing protein [Bacteroidales bacterium]|nr:thioredoxin-like domain-containing protein [Bacteroidales bacterium]